MSERLNGGPFTLGYGQQCYVEYWWGNGDDRHLAYASAHPVGKLPNSGGSCHSMSERCWRDQCSREVGTNMA